MKNNRMKYIMFFLLMMLIFIPSVNALEYNSLCTDEGIMQAMKILGYVIMLAKWIVPLIIIVLGMIDYAKAVISNDEKATLKATEALIRRFIAGVAVFFIPTLITGTLNFIEVTGNIENEAFGACTKCLFDPTNSCEVISNPE